MRPIHLEVGGRDVIRIHGRRCDPAKLRIAVVLAIILTVISCFVLALFSMIMVPCATPGGLGWVIIILRLSNAIDDDYLKLSPKGRVAYNDRKCWLSIEVEPDCWFSLYTVKGMLMFRKDRLVYEQTKRYLHSEIGDRLVAKS